jgi:hypothetical protein
MSSTGDYYSKQASNTVLPIWGILNSKYSFLHTRLNAVVCINEILSNDTMWSPCSLHYTVASHELSHLSSTILRIIL